MFAKNYNLKTTTTVKIGELRYPAIRLGEIGRARKEEYIIVEEDIENAKFVEVKKIGEIYCIKKVIEEVKTDWWIARINTDWRYKRNCFGYVGIKKSQKDNVKIIGLGKGAFGLAGRIGDWYDYALLARDGTILYVNPSGAYICEKYYLYFTENRVLKMTREELKVFEALNETKYNKEEPFDEVLTQKDSEHGGE